MEPGGETGVPSFPASHRSRPPLPPGRGAKLGGLAGSCPVYKSFYASTVPRGRRVFISPRCQATPPACSSCPEPWPNAPPEKAPRQIYSWGN